MVTFHHIKHKPIGGNASPLFYEFQKCSNMHNNDDSDAWLPFFLESVELVYAPPADFLPPWWLSGLVSRWNFFTKKALPNTGRDNFSIFNWNPAFDLALAPIIEVKDWDNPSEDYWWACVRDQLMQPYRQASLWKTKSLISWRKRNC